MTANLRLKGTTYHYRRRVPPPLTQYFGRSEILLTLGTGSAREAAARARAVNVEIDKVIRAVTTKPNSLAVEHIALILRRLRAEPPWASPTRAELLAEYRTGDAATIDRVFALGTDAIFSLPPEDRQRVLDHLERLLDGVAIVSSEAGTAAARLGADVATLRAATAETLAAQAQRRADLATMAMALQQRPAAAPAVTPAASQSPEFSEHERAFLDWKRTQKGWTAQSGAQAEATFRLARELIGDKPVKNYTRQDAGLLYDELLRLPSSHGKGAAKGKAIPARDAIARADAIEKGGTAVPRVQLKTVKRHFSALLQYWKWLHQRGHVDELIWSGFDFPGTKSSKKKRDIWSPDDMKKLFSSTWWAVDQPRDTARWWAPLIALYSGMRLEEICRLRPIDVETMKGAACFLLREHPDGWSPKTEAGERTVPVHPFLVELGFLRLVEQRRREDAPRLFPELRATGRDGKLGQALGRDFGRLKTGLGVGPKTVFHSFRHTFRTVLESADLEERWIDSVMGHEDSRRSEGGRTYAKGVTLERLAQVVAAFEAPVDLSHMRGSRRT
ncbi:Site-specific recombinase XerD [Azospirillum oryzae]|uniref:Site-specific recombinase XerD n=1 Tax=Azospirillum oryzae TaxID=286727 RepID=A0A1X7EMS9_9PROT|nr:site-specific integrase [Azospirillum oryzae]SMF36643.1 Site-specific recombinase XerD [Azospirillum oryzae]